VHDLHNTSNPSCVFLFVCFYLKIIKCKKKKFSKSVTMATETG